MNEIKHKSALELHNKTNKKWEDLFLLHILKTKNDPLQLSAWSRIRSGTGRLGLSLSSLLYVFSPRIVQKGKKKIRVNGDPGFYFNLEMHRGNSPDLPLPNFLCHSSSRPTRLPPLPETKCDFSFFFSPCFSPLPQQHFLPWKRPQQCCTSATCVLWGFSSARFLFWNSRRQIQTKKETKISEGEKKTADTSSLCLNVEPQSSLCPIPINYFTSPKSSAGILSALSDRGHAASWQRPRR